MAFLSPHEEAYNIMEENLFADCLSIAVYNRGNPIDNDDLQVLFIMETTIKFNGVITLVCRI
jgi:hypothetical protein